MLCCIVWSSYCSSSVVSVDDLFFLFPGLCFLLVIFSVLSHMGCILRFLTTFGSLSRLSFPAVLAVLLPPCLSSSLLSIVCLPPLSPFESPLPLLISGLSCGRVRCPSALLMFRLRAESFAPLRSVTSPYISLCLPSLGGSSGFLCLHIMLSTFLSFHCSLSLYTSPFAISPVISLNVLYVLISHPRVDPLSSSPFQAFFHMYPLNF